MAKEDCTPAQKLSADELRSLLVYNPETGIFTNKVTRGRGAIAGNKAGTATKNGYISIKIRRAAHSAHRLAWLYVYGRWPEKQIDHINGVRSDNRIKNLRDVSAFANQQNRREAKKNNGLGAVGVKRNGARFSANIDANGSRHYLGTFDSISQASMAYQTAKTQMHGL